MNIRKFLSPATIGLSIIVGLVLVITSVWTFTKAADFNLFATLGADKNQVVPGDSLQYTVTVRNDGTQNLDNVRVNQNFIPQITYVNGSTTAEKGVKTVSVDDGWTGAGGFNFGTLTPGQSGLLRFSATISASATIGSTLQNAVAIRSDQTDWIGRAHPVTVVSTNNRAVFRTGDTFQGVNNTFAEQNWRDEINATMGNIIQFKFRIVNDGNFESRGTKVWIQIPWDPKKPSSTLVSSAQVTADNADSMTDTATVNLTGTPSFLWPYDGHYVIVGTTNLFNCPNGCPITREFLDHLMPIGNIIPGASVEILFKSSVFNIASSTPTPTPTATPTMTPTATPTSTPSPSPTPTSGPTSSCQNLTASITSGTKPLTITFTGSGTDSAGSVQQYQFNFGDNSNGQDQIVTTSNNQASHVYYNSGNFTANLLVKDSRGSWVGGGNCSLNINVSNPPTVLGTSAPTVLPKTGNNDVIYLFIASIPTIIGGIYLYRKFKLI